MTDREFRLYYKGLRDELPGLTQEAMSNLADIYERAVYKVAEIVRYAEAENLSEITSGTWRQIGHELQQAADQLREALRAQVQASVEGGADLVTQAHKDYLEDIIDMSNGKITKRGIENTFASVDRKLMAALINKTYKDGYTFSERIWEVGENMMTCIKNVVNLGVSMGRDVLDIAKDLEVYLKGGRQRLAKRYGDLIEGTPDWKSRIGTSVDYRALRLIRSELYQSIQDATLLSSKMNPACTGMFDWVRHTSEDWNCSCPDYEKNSPYTYDQVPAYPHPNCLCTIIPHLMNGQEFFQDVKRWANGEEVGYLDEWYTNYYSQIAA